MFTARGEYARLRHAECKRMRVPAVVGWGTADPAGPGRQWDTADERSPLAPSLQFSTRKRAETGPGPGGSGRKRARARRPACLCPSALYTGPGALAAPRSQVPARLLSRGHVAGLCASHVPARLHSKPEAPRPRRPRRPRPPPSALTCPVWGPAGAVQADPSRSPSAGIAGSRQRTPIC